MPVPSGPAARHIVLTLVTPSTGRSGGTLAARATFRLAKPGLYAPNLGQPADVVIVKDRMVVGAYLGAVGGTGVGASTTAQAIALSSPVLLRGCPIGTIDYARPNATRRPLPAGTYDLFAVMSSGGAGIATSVIVSAPARVTVTD